MWVSCCFFKRSKSEILDRPEWSLTIMFLFFQQFHHFPKLKPSSGHVSWVILSNHGYMLYNGKKMLHASMKWISSQLWVMWKGYYTWQKQKQFKTNFHWNFWNAKNCSMTRILLEHSLKKRLEPRKKNSFDRL